MHGGLELVVRPAEPCQSTLQAPKPSNPNHLPKLQKVTDVNNEVVRNWFCSDPLLSFVENLQGTHVVLTQNGEALEILDGVLSAFSIFTWNQRR
jgi:hypothetical protein